MSSAVAQPERQRLEVRTNSAKHTRSRCRTTAHQNTAVFRLAKQRQLVSILVAARCRRVTASSVQAYIARQIEEAA
jgi:hypothetical protein